MMAALYDASLDAFAPHSWFSRIGNFRREFFLNRSSHNLMRESAKRMSSFRIQSKQFSRQYPVFNPVLTALPRNFEGYELSPFAAAPGGEGFIATRSLAGSRVQAESLGLGSSETSVGDTLDTKATGGSGIPKKPAPPRPLTRSRPARTCRKLRFSIRTC
jgi:hypothetical protein